MWGIVKKAINSTVGKGMKTLDNISKEDTAQSIYGMAKLLSEANLLPTSVLIAPRVPELPSGFLSYNNTVTTIIFAPETKEVNFEGIYDCYKLKELYLPSIQNIATGSIVGNTSLEVIVFSKLLTEIGYEGLRGNSALKYIFYDGTVADWNNISKGDDWDAGCGSYTVVCADGQIVKA